MLMVQPAGGLIVWEIFSGNTLGPLVTQPHTLCMQLFFLSSLSVCAFVSSRGQTGEGEWAEHSGENLLSGYSTHPKQVGDFFFLHLIDYI